MNQSKKKTTAMGVSKPNTNNNATIISINLGISILITLLAANFVALIIHVWYFLPLSEHHHNLFSSSSYNEDGLPICSLATTTNATTHYRSSSIFQKRIRCSLNNKETIPASQAIQHALFSSSSSSSSSLEKNEIVRYDIVPTILDQTRDYYGIVHQLPSIPNRRRMIPSTLTTFDTSNEGNINEQQLQQYFVPTNAIHNLTYFLEARIRPNEEDRPLYIYNPMVLPLNNKVLNYNILSDLLLGFGEEEDTSVNRAAYIAVFRISNFGNCHGPGKGVPETYRNYLGLALLDIDLNIIQDPTSGEYIDVVIDLNEALFDVKWSPWIGRGGRTPKKVKQYMQDCQLVAAPSNEKKKKADQLILICNEYAMHVRLQRASVNSTTTTEKKNTDEIIHFKNTYGSGLQLTALKRPNVIIMKGKNLHYFQQLNHSNDAQEIPGPGYLEVWPGGPHEVLPMNFENYPFAKMEPNSKPEDNPVQPIKATQLEEPALTFNTIDSKDSTKPGPLITRDSGSACCVSIRWKDSNGEERHLLLGFSHRKTKKTVRKEAQYNYVSRVYAFEPSPPFNIVARSGFFCLGFALTPGNIKSKVRDTSISTHLDDEANQSDNEQVYGSANDSKLRINGMTFECPRIHFITGIAEKLGEEEKVIISYGVNDCYPRMIEVSKSFLISLLKPP